MKKALILIDVQEDFLGNTQDYIAPLCQNYLAQFGSSYDLVILTHWKHEENKDQNTLLLEYADAKVVEKRTYSALTPEVNQLLLQHDICEVHLAGVDAEMAVMATMYHLIDQNYDVKILERLCASYHGRNWEATTIMRHVLGDANVLSVGGGRVWV
ncbi:isochorismatase family protein [Fodinisporobacter ferrooxydans]|uniref:Isochorismatase family protein n=1 Tax=Fodinisporobacter ferrooxydans TaxID=2901836 RepID=A0ABY4CF17_9BACL|nr:isochorismatase family protein [Alicyclobacillaceae bacterium MYW30-H2]